MMPISSNSGKLRDAGSTPVSITFTRGPVPGIGLNFSTFVVRVYPVMLSKNSTNELSESKYIHAFLSSGLLEFIQTFLLLGIIPKCAFIAKSLHEETISFVSNIIFPHLLYKKSEKIITSFLPFGRIF